MIDDDEIRFTTTEQLTDEAVFVSPTTIVQSTRGPICPICGQLCAMTALDSCGKGDCSRCPCTFGFMAMPSVQGCVWSTWEVDEESEGE